MTVDEGVLARESFECKADYIESRFAYCKQSHLYAAMAGVEVCLNGGFRVRGLIPFSIQQATTS